MSTGGQNPLPPSLGSWEFTVPGWVPPSQNPYIGPRWREAGVIKQTMAALLGCYALVAGVRRVDHRHRAVRHVSLVVTGWGEGRTPPDADNIVKLFLDSARRAGLIVDDRAEWCTWDRPELVIGSPDSTLVRLRDVAIRPPCDPLDDPYTRRLWENATRRTNPRRKAPKSADPLDALRLIPKRKKGPRRGKR